MKTVYVAYGYGRVELLDELLKEAEDASSIVKEHKARGWRTEIHCIVPNNHPTEPHDLYLCVGLRDGKPLAGLEISDFDCPVSVTYPSDVRTIPDVYFSSQFTYQLVDLFGEKDVTPMIAAVLPEHRDLLFAEIILYAKTDTPQREYHAKVIGLAEAKDFDGLVALLNNKPPFKEGRNKESIMISDQSSPSPSHASA